MGVVDIPFPKTSQPGSQPGEGLGRLLNNYFEADGDVALWRRVPGLIPFADTGLAVPRGMIDVDGTLYDARTDAVVTVTPSAVVTPLTGALNGVDLVTWEHNNAAPTHDLVAVCAAGTFSITSTTVSPYPSLAVPAAFNSVDFLDGYFLFTTGDGRIFASGVNDIWVDDTDHTQNSLAFTTADQSGSLVRGTVWAEQYFAWGTKATTVYQNAATSPFPLSRLTIIPVGLASASAICGFEPGWSLQQFFVATDNTVQKMNGTTPETVSNKDVERAITAQADKTKIEMSCYVIGGRPTIVLRGPNFTWEMNAVTGYWNERQSPNLANWRASHSVYFDQKWLVGDTATTQILQLVSTTFAELETSYMMRLESGPVKQYPNRLRCKMAAFDWTTGQGSIGGTEDSQHPEMAISSSIDGGGTWSTPIIRRTLGGQGDYQRMIRVNRIAGISTQHGIRFRLDVSSPIYETFRGGRCDVDLLAPP